MVIQCKQCETTYNFDESALQAEAVEVRCVRCKNVFTIDATSSMEREEIQAPVETSSTAFVEPTIPKEDLQPQPAPEPEPLPEWDTDSDAFSFSPSNDFSFTDDPDLTPESVEPIAVEDKQESADFTFESLNEEPQEVVASAPTLAPEPIAKPAPVQEIEETAAPINDVKDDRPQQDKKGKTSKLTLLILLIILMIVGAYGYFFVTLGTTDVMRMIESIQQQLTSDAPRVQGEVRVNTTQSYYINNDAAGQLFVIQGVATNHFSAARSEICVKGTLYQKKGAPLIHQTAYCGNIIAAEELKNAPMESLVNQMTNPFGAALSNVNIAPGQSLPFMIVFSDLPDELNEFSVEPESSKASAN